MKESALKVIACDLVGTPRCDRNPARSRFVDDAILPLVRRLQERRGPPSTLSQLSRREVRSRGRGQTVGPPERGNGRCPSWRQRCRFRIQIVEHHRRQAPRLPQRLVEQQ